MSSKASVASLPDPDLAPAAHQRAAPSRFKPYDTNSSCKAENSLWDVLQNVGFVTISIVQAQDMTILKHFIRYLDGFGSGQFSDRHIYNRLFPMISQLHNAFQTLAKKHDVPWRLATHGAKEKEGRKAWIIRNTVEGSRSSKGKTSSVSLTICSSWNTSPCKQPLATLSCLCQDARCLGANRSLSCLGEPRLLPPWLRLKGRLFC